MKIDNFITSVNNNNIYSSFIELVSIDYMQNFNSKLHIAFIDYTEDEVEQYKDICIPHMFNTLDNVDSGVQAKATRMWLASEIEGNNMIVDIDMFILDKQFVIDEVSKIPEDKVFAWAWNAYSEETTNTKWLMPFSTANNNVWKSIVNPDDLGYVDLFKSWSNIRYYDDKEDVTNQFLNFSDESLLRGLVFKTKSNDTISYVTRDDYVNFSAQKRMDRARWYIDHDKLHANYYIDCWSKRPLNVNEMKPVLNYLNIEV